MVFGAGRMMWATDFPWIDVDPGYGEVVRLPDEVFPDLTPEERSRLMGGTAAQVLRFPAFRDSGGWLAP